VYTLIESMIGGVSIAAVGFVVTKYLQKTAPIYIGDLVRIISENSFCKDYAGEVVDIDGERVSVYFKDQNRTIKFDIDEIELVQDI
jgi:hypothetical protein